MQRIAPLKIIIAGDGASGKTSLLRAKNNIPFQLGSKITIGVDIQCVSFQTDTNRFGAIVFDLGGQNRFQFMHDAYIKGAKAAIVLYDLTRPQTFDNLGIWIERLLKENANIPIIIAGTKKDIAQPEDITFFSHKWLEIRPNISWATNVITHLFCSSKTNEGIEEIFSVLGKALTNSCAEFHENILEIAS